MNFLYYTFEYLGISLMHRGDCYLNGSYFLLSYIYGKKNKLICSYPNSSITNGEWLAPDGSLICIRQNKNKKLRCVVDSFNDVSSISIWLREMELDDFLDGVYSCCLPSGCSDPSSSIITANIFSEIFMLSNNFIIYYRVHTNSIIYC